MNRWSVFAFAALVAATAVSAAFSAEKSYVPERKVLQQSDVPGSNYVTIMTLTTIAPNETVARHTHPGTELSYILEGEGDLTIEDKTQHIKAGESFRIEEHSRHSLKNGPKPMKIMAIYVVTKGQPLATLAPE